MGGRTSRRRSEEWRFDGCDVWGEMKYGEDGVYKVSILSLLLHVASMYLIWDSLADHGSRFFELAAGTKGSRLRCLLVPYIRHRGACLPWGEYKGNFSTRLATSPCDFKKWMIRTCTYAREV